MEPSVIKFDNNLYQIDVLMEGKPGRMSCYYIDSACLLYTSPSPRDS